MARIYLAGHAGTGKTERLNKTLARLIEAGTRPDRILGLFSQRAAIERVRKRLSELNSATRGEPMLTTLNGFAQRQVSLFFPVIREAAGFAPLNREPVFLNVESAQYFLNQHLEPHMPAFEGLNLFRPRIVSQVLDNLNRAANGGFPLDQIAARLVAAWRGDPARGKAYEAAQQAAIDFRAFCLENGLLDFSLTMDVFMRHLLRNEAFAGYARARFRHVLIDNVEEGAPPLHALAELLLPSSDSALLVEDDPGGYRVFLGADTTSARRLRNLCDVHESTDDVRIAADTPARFGVRLALALAGENVADVSAPRSAAQVPSGKYWTTMVQHVVDEIQSLIACGIAPADIAIVAPFVEDVLRFELDERLGAEIGLSVLRPSRPLNDHPVVRALVVLAKLAHPSWGALPSAGEIARALSQCIDELDVVRAQLLADHIMRVGAGPQALALPPVEDGALWERVGLRFRERYSAVRAWLLSWHARRSAAAAAAMPLDLFWQQLFTEVLSTEGFRQHHDREGAVAVERLVRSARQFREVFDQCGLSAGVARWSNLRLFAPNSLAEIQAANDIAMAYLSMLSEGMLAAQFSAVAERADGVKLAPVFAYLTTDARSRVQIWLDVQSSGWHERIFQPLTHPYVLTRDWPPARAWTDADELQAGRELLARVLQGLANRCREQILLASSQLTISGQEESGVLARLLQRTLRPGPI